MPALDTLVIGARRTFAVGPELSPTHGVVRWTTSDPKVVTVDQSGVAMAMSSGRVELRAIDAGSPANCPDQWYGALVVR
ncbi:MAG: Ig-like domain-containing protein [Gemmatimonadaceae bacterium]|nr:Ig-like domain-containing protein [Gemmatimonadaceae bacterium]